ncbi:hypothetical protein PBY51_023969 [Eleginops maclovinus]|uniref:Uncharacterized protein n=1 Tax=Eleginops maclovinus TaxID=56733 RepID=A0AAN7XYH2_ELEMC|nr:hypothetical protein PBY51_023969 [Eleginops maclovinus]
MKSGLQPAPLQPRWANLRLLLACCFTEHAPWDARHTACTALPCPACSLRSIHPSGLSWVSLSPCPLQTDIMAGIQQDPWGR